MNPYSTADLIRRAEEDIASGKPLLALGLLAEAARREPLNPYIGALVEKADEGVERLCSSPAGRASDATPSERRAQLATLAARGEFGDGFGLLSSESPDPAAEGRVRLLTMVATNLYERGSFEEAVQSLMKAHLLDAKSPHVAQCERLLRPALETMRKGPATAPAATKQVPQEVESGGGDISAYLQRQGLPASRPAAAGALEIGPQTAGVDSRRLEMLRARQDLERRKHEIQQWRQASGPPGQRSDKSVRESGKKVHGTAPQAQGSAPPVKQAGKRIPQTHPQTTSQLSAFFSKLMQGKLFG